MNQFQLEGNLRIDDKILKARLGLINPTALDERITLAGDIDVSKNNYFEGEFDYIYNSQKVKQYIEGLFFNENDEQILFFINYASKNQTESKLVSVVHRGLADTDYKGQLFDFPFDYDLGVNLANYKEVTSDGGDLGAFGFSYPLDISLIKKSK